MFVNHQELVSCREYTTFFATAQTWPSSFQAIPATTYYFITPPVSQTTEYRSFQHPHNQFCGEFVSNMGKIYKFEVRLHLYTTMTHTTVNVLVIEDHAVVQLGISTLLSTCNTIGLIDRASSGTEAISKFLDTHFDVVLIDIELPDMSGFELLARLRKHLPTVKVLFYSMHDEFWIVRQMFRSEADGIVMKSDRLDELRTAMETILSGEKYFSKEYEQFLKEYEQQEELSPQEINVLRLISEGLTSQQIATRLYVSLNTIEFHRRRIMRKLAATNMADLIKKAIEKGYL